MSRRHYSSGWTPIEAARESKDTSGTDLFDPSSVGRVQELTDGRRWDALRGITHLANRYGWSVDDVREVVCALGLVGVQERTEEQS